jgi:hypothetical protein
MCFNYTREQRASQGQIAPSVGQKSIYLWNDRTNGTNAPIARGGVQSLKPAEAGLDRGSVKGLDHEGWRRGRRSARGRRFWAAESLP